MRKDSSEQLVGNAQFEGYSVDLIHDISRILGFNYTIHLVQDNRYGSLNKVTKEWDGMIKELLEQKADLAIADLTITYDREQAVDFTMPFMNLVKLMTLHFKTITTFLIHKIVAETLKSLFEY